jgi:hypothetical protein
MLLGSYSWLCFVGTNANPCGVPAASLSCLVANSCLVPFLSEQGIRKSLLIFNHWAVPYFQVDFSSWEGITYISFFAAITCSALDYHILIVKKTRPGRGKPPSPTSPGTGTQGAHNPLMAKNIYYHILIMIMWTFGFPGSVILGCGQSFVT